MERRESEDRGEGKGNDQRILRKVLLERTMEGVTKRGHLENRCQKGTPAMPFVTAQQECSSSALKEAWGHGEKQGIVK